MSVLNARLTLKRATRVIFSCVDSWSSQIYTYMGKDVRS